jgi:hypothetical protein
LAEDSHPLFNLPVPNTKDVLFDDIDKPPFFLGVVTEKQYCMVKKEGTRYRVPIGTKFCRIKVKPMPLATSTTIGTGSLTNLSSSTAPTANKTTIKRERHDCK